MFFFVFIKSKMFSMEISILFGGLFSIEVEIEF